MIGSSLYSRACVVSLCFDRRDESDNCVVHFVEPSVNGAKA